MREAVGFTAKRGCLPRSSIHAYPGKEVKYELSISPESPQMSLPGEFMQTLTNEKEGEFFSIIQLMRAAESIRPLLQAAPAY